MTPQVEHNPDETRYELLLDGNLIGVADYRPRDGKLVFPHTEITPALRGQGYGDILVKGALDDVRARGESVVPTCWFVREFIDNNPEYADLLAA